nr:hypothetical protein [Haliscomenobacter sp.]
MKKTVNVLLFTFGLVLGLTAQSKPLSPEKIEALKKEATEKVQARAKLAQVMVDKVFSFAELGFQEVETSKYLTGILRDNGFAIESGISGVPTAWMARWGSGKPVIAIGSDLDCIPKASQKPGVAYHDPIVEGAPGHGEGHNSGIPLNIIAAITVKEIMEREKIPGTLVLWPGVAEELVGTKAFLPGMGTSIRSMPVFSPTWPTTLVFLMGKPWVQAWFRLNTSSKERQPMLPEHPGVAGVHWMQ